LLKVAIFQQEVIMSILRLVWISILFVLMTFSNIPCVGAQSDKPIGLLAMAEKQPVGEIDFRTANKKALEKLSRMSPEQIEALDKKLAEALTLYYDRKFAGALPVFKQIAAEVETMDILFWLGTSAMKAGESELAIEKFKQMLAIDPNLHRVRLELSTTYFTLGRYEDARRELEIVQAASPPPAVQANIEKLLGAIEESSRKVSWNLRLSQGYMWDDNISSGPDLKEYAVLGGTLTPATQTAELSDEAAVTNMAGNFLYDMGDRESWMWNSALSFYYKAYNDFSQFNYLALDFNTGPWWANYRDIVKIPFGYTEQKYGSDRLSHIIHMDPSFERHFNRNFSLKALCSFSRENYYGDTRSGLDSNKQRYELTPNFYLADRRHIISATTGFENHNADVGRFSYDGLYFAASYFTRFRNKTELFFRYRLALRNYDALPLFYNTLREDKRHGFTAVVSREFYKNLFASFAYNFTRNDSNLELYEYDKTTKTISIGCRF
jgi:tetratricopeptide (TPR) repeat protein